MIIISVFVWGKFVLDSVLARHSRYPPSDRSFHFFITPCSFTLFLYFDMCSRAIALMYSIAMCNCILGYTVRVVKEFVILHQWSTIWNYTWSLPAACSHAWSYFDQDFLKVCHFTIRIYIMSIQHRLTQHVELLVWGRISLVGSFILEILYHVALAVFGNLSFWWSSPDFSWYQIHFTCLPVRHGFLSTSRYPNPDITFYWTGRSFCVIECLLRFFGGFLIQYMYTYIYILSDSRDLPRPNLANTYLQVLFNRSSMSDTITHRVSIL